VREPLQLTRQALKKDVAFLKERTRVNKQTGRERGRRQVAKASSVERKPE
jgi:hypothetical protein